MHLSCSFLFKHTFDAEIHVVICLKQRLNSYLSFCQTWICGLYVVQTISRSIRIFLLSRLMLICLSTKEHQHNQHIMIIYVTLFVLLSLGTPSGIAGAAAASSRQELSSSSSSSSPRASSSEKERQLVVMLYISLIKLRFCILVLTV